MRDFKKYTSTKIRQKLEEDNMQNILGRLKTNAEGKKNQVFKLWMDRFDDVMIYTESVLWTKIQYIHNNPVRKELVEKPEDWKYSSYKSYIEDNDGLIEIVNQF